MRYPKFSIAALAWLTAVVAVAAALPRVEMTIHFGTNGESVSVSRHQLPLAWELVFRGVVVAVLLLVVWLGHLAYRWLNRRRTTQPRPVGPYNGA